MLARRELAMAGLAATRKKSSLNPSHVRRHRRRATVGRLVSGDRRSLLRSAPAGRPPPDALSQRNKLAVLSFVVVHFRASTARLVERFRRHFNQLMLRGFHRRFESLDHYIEPLFLRMKLLE